MMRLDFWLLLLAACTLLAGCFSESEPPSPRTLPYVLEPALELKANPHPVDLDGDGVDEILYRYTPSSRPPGVMAVWMQTQSGATIEQVNFQGKLLPLHTRDLNRNGTLEVLVPFTRNDSLFVSAVDARGRKLLTFFLISGEPRQEPDGVLPWDPVVRNFYLADVDADGSDDLITIVFTAFARLPRGVLVHRLPEGEPIGRRIVGAGVGKSFLKDVTGDATPEVILQTHAPNNGAVAGGFDDRHSYAMVFAFTPEPEVAWARETGGLWTGTQLAFDDFDGDAQPELLTVTTTASSKPEEARFELIEPGTWRTLRRRTFAEPLRWPAVLDLDHDAQPEIVALRGPGEVWVFNAQFEVVRRRRVAASLSQLRLWPDIDGDGVEEIAVYTRNKVLLLDPALRVKSAYHSTSGIIGVLRRGIGTDPFLLVPGRSGTVVALKLVENRLWWLYRYGPYALGGLGLAAVLGIGLGARAWRRRNRLLQHLYPAAFDEAANGLLVLDAQGDIVLANATLCDWLGFDAPHRIERAQCDDVLDWYPALASFLHQALTRDPPHHHEEALPLKVNGRRRTVHATAEPMLLNHGEGPYWLVAFREEHDQTAHLDAKTWAMMAKKVTHDLKTPLTNILLTTQRLQTEYRKRAPMEAEALDSYTERILNRVTALRRMTKQFMKILDVDALDLVRTDLSAFVRETQEALAQDLPPVIELAFDLQPDLPPVLLDQEQMQAVLENLISNAFHALPEGGTITISTYSVLNLRSAHTGYEPHDYVVLEVQDNGIGIPETDHARLFEPGFTTSEFGTGLGLALVRRAITHHGGFIEVESEPGAGSVFSLYLLVDASRTPSTGWESTKA